MYRMLSRLGCQALPVAVWGTVWRLVLLGELLGTLVALDELYLAALA